MKEEKNNGFLAGRHIITINKDAIEKNTTNKDQVHVLSSINEDLEKFIDTNEINSNDIFKELDRYMSE